MTTLTLLAMLFILALLCTAAAISKKHDSVYWFLVGWCWAVFIVNLVCL